LSRKFRTLLLDELFILRAFTVTLLSVGIFLLFSVHNYTRRAEYRMEEFVRRVAALESQVMVRTDDRFRRADWLAQKEILDVRFRELESQLDRLDLAIRSHAEAEGRKK
jgi:hypothetical protein